MWEYTKIFLLTWVDHSTAPSLFEFMAVKMLWNVLRAKNALLCEI